MLAVMYICQSGTPFIYQGQEIGMTNIKINDLSRYKDVVTFNNYKIFKKLGFSDKKFLEITNRATRENSRTPMQWSDKPGQALQRASRGLILTRIISKSMLKRQKKTRTLC
jgi:glycosidase